VVFAVSVIEALEEVTSEDQLDPEHYGVVVSTPDGRHGCLLPGIPELRTVEQQLEMARRKAGILAGEPVRLQRFTAAKFQETEVDRPREVR
jgi:AMMECR1 domain-containing protein